MKKQKPKAQQQETGDTNSKQIEELTCEEIRIRGMRIGRAADRGCIELIKCSRTIVPKWVCHIFNKCLLEEEKKTEMRHI